MCGFMKKYTTIAGMLHSAADLRKEGNIKTVLSVHNHAICRRLERVVLCNAICVPRHVMSASSQPNFGGPPLPMLRLVGAGWGAFICTWPWWAQPCPWSAIGGGTSLLDSQISSYAV